MQNLEHRYEYGIGIEVTGIDLNRVKHPVRLKHGLASGNFLSEVSLLISNGLTPLRFSAGSVSPLILPSSFEKTFTVNRYILQSIFNANLQNRAAISMGTLCVIKKAARWVDHDITFRHHFIAL